MELFSNCGSLAMQLNTDLEVMGVPSDFAAGGYVLPMSYGYIEGKYFASELADRSNEWITLFESEKKEDFRWFILKSIASKWGEKEARADEEEQRKQWTDRYAGYSYDWRKAWWEYEISCLLKVYDITDEYMIKHIASRESLLGIIIDGSKKRHWKYDRDSKKFILEE